MGTGRMGSLIRTTAENIVDAAGQPVFGIVAQIGFDLSELESAPAADVIIDFSNAASTERLLDYCNVHVVGAKSSLRHSNALPYMAVL